MAKIVTCPICGKEFETDRPHKKYCSFVCREAGRQVRRMEWMSKNPDYNKLYMRKYKAKKKSEGGKL